MNLTDFLTSASFPYTAEIAVGGGRKLAVTYRAADPARAKAAILAVVTAGLTALGFDPETTLKAAAGQVPRGEAADDFRAALAALDTDGEAQFETAMRLADGAGVADVLGSIEAVTEDGERLPLEGITEGAVTAETCAALPVDLKKTILALAANAMLPAEKLDFLGQSPHSSREARRAGKGRIPR